MSVAWSSLRPEAVRGSSASAPAGPRVAADLVRDRGEALPSMQTTIASRSPGCRDRRVLGEASWATSSRPRGRARDRRARRRERIPAGARERADVDVIAPRARRGWAAAKPAPSSAGSSSNSSPNTSATAATAAGRTSSTEIGRPSSRAIVVNCGVLEAARGDPLRERRGIEVDVERVAVRRHPARDVHADGRDLPRALPCGGASRRR